MIVKKLGSGPWADYQINGAAVTIESLEIDCQAIQSEHPVVVDVCDDGAGNMVIGSEAGRRYVANLIVPPQNFHKEPTGETDIDGNPLYQRVAEPLDANKIKLNLWPRAEKKEVTSL